ncbi:MAG: hypothetical protein AAF401_17525 [Pseudomonadota bacterium]
MSEDRVPCRTPAEGRDGATNIPRWKFDLLREAILEVCAEEVRFSELQGRVGALLSDQDKASLGSLGWHTTTVKLELEVRGEISRVNAPGPQRIIRTAGGGDNG